MPCSLFEFCGGKINKPTNTSYGAPSSANSLFSFLPIHHIPSALLIASAMHGFRAGLDIAFCLCTRRRLNKSIVGAGLYEYTRLIQQQACVCVNAMRIACELVGFCLSNLPITLTIMNTNIKLKRERDFPMRSEAMVCQQ